ncbi:antibiotic biosynthesis monooxygenase [Streptomyces sp. LP11]|uniref:Antibiotic biosynthesis monooxygenase n=1 Tax=Streptomyces pyxinicus TaxID=2970331 RepID=A0ABT2B567_9ACTN|nr:putative quinol monooxygenase [Streptomyces sp. LP11]MCS0603575.1 antibiotic biosynthesis monooxygenase [Streptomyces sp. LP11]
MIFITVRFTIRPEHAEEWPERVRDFTEATRAEPGNVFFDWARDLEHPDRYVLVEAFADADAGRKHVESAHFKTAMSWMPDVVASTPEIINTEVPGTGWDRMGEVTPR